MINVRVMKRASQLVIVSCCFLLLAVCYTSAVSSADMADATGKTVSAAGQTTKKPNILVIIGDDMGVETLGSYGIGPDTPTTGTLDSLAANGVSFDNFWSQSACSPTRATILTGRYGFRTGIGAPIGKNDAAKPATLPTPEWATREQQGKAKAGNGPPNRDGVVVVTGGKSTNDAHTLQNSEFTLPMAFDAETNGYHTAAIGKWHLADRYNGWMDHPNLTGFDYFSGLMGGSPEGYFSWIEVTNGQPAPMTGYTPINKVDNSIQWIKEQGDEPWFLWLAFNLPHNPLHKSPTDLMQSDYSNIDPQANPNDDRHPYLENMIEAMDTEIERLLSSLAPEVRENTYIVFLGDNGTEKRVIGAPYDEDHAKESLYQGGVNVPLIISGPGVKKGERSAALVNSTDLFSTIMEMAGIDVEATVPTGVKTDSVSVMPYLANPDKESIREFAFVDQFEEDVDTTAIRNMTHKLITFNIDGVEELYNLAADPYEHNNLLEGKLSQADQQQYDMLKKMVTDLRATAEI